MLGDNRVGIQTGGRSHSRTGVSPVTPSRRLTRGWGSARACAAVLENEQGSSEQ